MERKKLRVDNSTDTDTEIASCSTKCESPLLSSSNTIEDLPAEVLSAIFRYCSYREVSEKLRLVSRHFCKIATMVLNTGFLSLGPKLEQRMEAIEFAMKVSTSNADLLIMSRAFNALEILKHEYRLLKAVVWRYVATTFTGSMPLGCFYAGQIIDEYNRILDQVCHNPGTLAYNFYYHDFEHSSVGKLSSLVSRLENHFENITEDKLNFHYLISGSKIVDLLDCLMTNENEKPSYEHAEMISNENCCIKAHYRLCRAWFTCLNIDTRDAECSWRKEQRFMYLRLRRLISNNNYYVLRQMHHDRENLLQTENHFTPHLLEAGTYTGYGECGGRFYYYGILNKISFDSIVQRANGERNSEDGDDDNDRDDDNERPSIENGLMHLGPEPPCFDLDIAVEVNCPLYLAPSRYLETCKLPDVEYRYNHIIKTTNISSEEEHRFLLKMTINCTTSFANRLPSVFEWIIDSNDHPKKHLTLTENKSYCSIPTSDSQYFSVV